jgi:predicted glycosyltransferase
MAAEAAFLGTPVICVSTAKAGTLDEQVKLGLIELYRTSNGVTDRAVEMFLDQNLKDYFKNKVNNILTNFIDPTAFMTWFIENYPQSIMVMKNNPNYQFNFK